MFSRHRHLLFIMVTVAELINLDGHGSSIWTNVRKSQYRSRFDFSTMGIPDNAINEGNQLSTPDLTTPLAPGNGCRSESVLIQALLKGYDNRSRPVKNSKAPVLVSVDLYPIITEKLDEREQRLISHVWLYLEWKDEYLQWNRSEWNDIRYLTLDAGDIWTPELVIRNSAGSVHGEVVNSFADFKVIVSSDGLISMWTAGETETSCLVDITYFPFDDQACYIQINSWTDGDSRVKLINMSSTLDLSGYRVGGQWYVIGTEVHQEKLVEIYDEYTSLVFIMFLRRKPLYYVFNLVLPSVLLALLALLVFILPPEDGEKMTLGITVLLSFTVFQLLVTDSMPKTSDFIPVVGIYITTTMTMTAFSLALSVAVLSVHYHWPDEPVPLECQKMTDFVAKMLCMKTNWSSPSTGDPRLGVKFVDGLLQNNSQRCKTHKHAPEETGVLLKILDYVKYLKLAREDDNSAVVVGRDWIQLARVLDRLLLMIFLVFNVVSAFSLFLFFPLTKHDRPQLRIPVAPEVLF